MLGISVMSVLYDMIIFDSFTNEFVIFWISTKWMFLEVAMLWKTLSDDRINDPSVDPFNIKGQEMIVWNVSEIH